MSLVLIIIILVLLFGGGGGYYGYSMPRLARYLGRWIRHSGWYPDRKVRLYDRLFTVPEPDAGGDFKSFLNPHSLDHERGASNTSRSVAGTATSSWS